METWREPRSTHSFKVEEARREARLKEFKEQRAWRWSILGLKSRSRGIRLNLHFVLFSKILFDALYINLWTLKGICMTIALIICYKCFRCFRLLNLICICMIVILKSLYVKTHNFPFKWYQSQRFMYNVSFWILCIWVLMLCMTYYCFIQSMFIFCFSIVEKC